MWFSNLLSRVDYAALQRASRDVQEKCGYPTFEARSGLIATWHNVVHYDAITPYMVFVLRSICSLLITKQQHGFIQNRSACTILFKSSHDWTLNVRARANNDAIYVRFKKTFHSDCHFKLLIKPWAHGLSGTFCVVSWISACQTEQLLYAYSTCHKWCSKWPSPWLHIVYFVL